MESAHVPAKKRRRRLMSLWATTILASSIASPSLAQYSPDLRPSRPNIDENGIDLPSGTLVMDSVDLSVGAGPHPLTFVRRVEATSPNKIRHNFLIAYAQDSNTGDVQVQLPNKTKNFKYSGGNSWTNVDGTGETFDLATGYTDSDGVKYLFAVYTGAIQDNSSLWFASKISYPDGYVLDLNWSNGSIIIGDTNSYYFVKIIARLDSVRDNIGQKLSLFYKSALQYPNPNAVGFQTLTAAKIYTLGDEANPIQTANYQWDSSSSQFTVTVSGGIEKKYTISGGNEYSIDEGQNKLDLKIYSSTQYTPYVSKFDVKKSGVTSTYTYARSSSVDNLIVSTPGLYDRIYSISGALTATGGKVDAVKVNNVTSSYLYDTSGRVTDIVRSDGAAHYEYDARGNITLERISPKAGSSLPAITRKAGYIASCSNIPSCNQPTWTRDANEKQTDYSYDPSTGQLVSVTSPAPTTNEPRPMVSYQYQNVSGVSVPVTVSTCAVAQSCSGSAQEVKVTTAYDASLRPISVQTAAGDGSISSAISMGYDAAGNVTTVDGPLPGNADTTIYRYDAARQLAGVVSPDPDGPPASDGTGALKPRAQKFVRDSDGRLLRTEMGNVNSQNESDWAGFSSQQQTTMVYDAFGREARETLTAGGTTYQVTQYGYDAVGRLECTAVRMNSATWPALPDDAGTALPDACTPTTAGSGVVEADRITRNYYNSASQLTKVQTGYGTPDLTDEVTNSYNSSSKLESVTDAEHNMTRYEYDDFGRPSKTYYPVTAKGALANSESDYEQLGYDPVNGRVVSLRQRDGQTVTYAYDDLDRVVSKTPPSPELVVNYGYDLLGRMTTVSRPGDGVTHSFTYDALGQLVSETQPFGSVSYLYDTAGRRKRMTWNDGFYVGYDYLVTGEMRAVRENGASTGASVLATYGYDNLGRRKTLTRGNGTITNYGYDNVSRLTSLGLDLDGTSYDVSTGFTYNAASQITSKTRSNDIYSWDGYLNVNRSYTANGLNQLTKAGTTDLGYDLRGNLISSGNSAYTYTSDNLLKTAPGSVSIHYDAVGRLVEAGADVSTRFFYDGGHIAAEVANPSGAIMRRYVFGAGADEPLVWYEGSGTSDRRWLHADERGSIVALTDATGNVLPDGINRYDEYGIPAATNIGRFQYTGQTWIPELGMYYYKARIYSPTLGRFMQTDPIGYEAGLNMYAYVSNDPINFVDPNGLEEEPGLTVTGNCTRVGMRNDNGRCVVVWSYWAGTLSLSGVPVSYPLSRDPPPAANSNLRRRTPQNKPETAGERRTRLIELERRRTAKNAYCSKLQVDAAVSGFLWGEAGAATVGGADAFNRYGTWRATYRGALRGALSKAGLIVAGLMALKDFNTGADGDPRCKRDSIWD